VNARAALAARRSTASPEVYNEDPFPARSMMTQQQLLDTRRAALEAWLAHALGTRPTRVAPASADASFRRYFRVWHAGGTSIAMDAPPGHEDVAPYVQVASIMHAAGVNVPRVLAQDPAQGFLLLTDLGDRQYLDALRQGVDADRLYADAIRSLVRLQSHADPAGLPPYDATLLRQEMDLFPAWFLAHHLKLEPSPGERDLLEEVFAFLVESALRQPVVLVHRDYHSRNLMACDGSNPGILDFQDAVAGPVTYDLVSLLKDCYLTWPRGRVEAWVDLYRGLATEAGVDTGADRRSFLRDFDLMGLQRHVKVLGIFARLWYRDGKAGYLSDLPRVLEYVTEATAGEPLLRRFQIFLRERVQPVFAAAQARALSAA
jgi:aminoglycoside/choline kinase family phosphotransferase